MSDCQQCQGVVVVREKGGDGRGGEGSDGGKVLLVSGGVVDHKEELIEADHSIPVLCWRGLPRDVHMSATNILNGYCRGRG